MIFPKRSLPLAVLVGGCLRFTRADADPDCIGLFVERNRIYAEAHYCFKTKEALAYFSNESCIPGEPHLTRSSKSGCRNPA